MLKRFKRSILYARVSQRNEPKTFGVQLMKSLLAELKPKKKRMFSKFGCSPKTGSYRYNGFGVMIII